MPGETELVTTAIETYGVAGALLVVILALFFLAYKLGMAWIEKQHAAKPAKESKPDDPSRTVGTETIRGLTRDEIERATEDSKEALVRLDKAVERVNDVNDDQEKRISDLAERVAKLEGRLNGST